MRAPPNQTYRPYGITERYTKSESVIGTNDRADA